MTLFQIWCQRYIQKYPQTNAGNPRRKLRESSCTFFDWWINGRPWPAMVLPCQITFRPREAESTLSRTYKRYCDVMTFALVRDVAERNVKNLHFFLIEVQHTESVTEIRCPQWSSNYGTHLEYERPGFNSPLRHIFLILHHLLNSLLYFRPNVISGMCLFSWIFAKILVNARFLGVCAW